MNLPNIVFSFALSTLEAIAHFREIYIVCPSSNIFLNLNQWRKTARRRRDNEAGPLLTRRQRPFGKLLCGAS